MEARGVYGAIAEDHLRAPRNLGKLDGADGVGTVEDDDSQTMVTVYVKLHERSGGEPTIAEARFRAFGCGGCIITGSIATVLAVGRPVSDAVALDGTAIERALDDGLPADQRYCAALAARALRLACQSATAQSEQPG
jgi:nitrogen fixation protein NifU and related proteins